MVTQNEYCTGATWEYKYPDATPGIALSTSLSHPWGSAPTYNLPQLLYGLGLSDAEGTVPTPFGPIEASSTFMEEKLVLVVEAPTGTTGAVSLAFSSSGGEKVEFVAFHCDRQIEGFNEIYYVAT